MSAPAALQKGYADGPGDRRLRLAILLVVAVSLFVVFLGVFLFNHADPKGDGMEMVGVGAAFMFIFLPLTLTAFMLAKESRHLVLAAALAGFAAFGYFALWFQLLDEMGIRPAPWA